MNELNEKIYNYLRDVNEEITTEEIAKKFFNVNLCNPTVIKIIRETLKRDPRFKENNDKWKIDSYHLNEKEISKSGLLFIVSQMFQPNLKEFFFLISICEIKEKKTQNRYFLLSDNERTLKKTIQKIKMEIPFKIEPLNLRKLVPEIAKITDREKIVFFHGISGGKNLLRFLENGGIFLENIIRLSSFLESLEIKEKILKIREREIELFDITENIIKNESIILEKLKRHSIKNFSELKKFIFSKGTSFDFSGKKFNRRFLANLPQCSGVYFFKSAQGEIIYIGKSKNLRKRVSSYFTTKEKNDEKLIKIQTFTEEITFKKTNTEFEAILEEAYLIKKLKPSINIREDSTIPFMEETLNDNLVVILKCEEEYLIQISMINREKGIILLNEHRDKIDKDKIEKLLNDFLFLQKTPRNVRFFGKDLLPFALRWLRINHKKINFLKQKDFSNKKEIAKHVFKLLDEDVGEKIFFQ